MEPSGPFLGKEDHLYHLQQGDKGIEPRKKLFPKIWAKAWGDYLKVTFTGPAGSSRVIRVSAKSAQDFLNGLPKDTEYSATIKTLWDAVFPHLKDGEYSDTMRALQKLSGQIRELSSGRSEGAGAESTSLITDQPDATDRLDMAISEFKAHLSHLTKEMEGKHQKPPSMAYFGITASVLQKARVRAIHHDYPEEASNLQHFGKEIGALHQALTSQATDEKAKQLDIALVTFQSGFHALKKKMGDQGRAAPLEQYFDITQNQLIEARRALRSTRLASTNLKSAQETIASFVDEPLTDSESAKKIMRRTMEKLREEWSMKSISVDGAFAGPLTPPTESECIRRFKELLLQMSGDFYSVAEPAFTIIPGLLDDGLKNCQNKEFLLLKSIWEDYQIRPKNKPEEELAAEVRGHLAGIYDTLQSMKLTVESLKSLFNDLPRVRETCEIFLESADQFEREFLASISEDKIRSLKSEWKKTVTKIKEKGLDPEDRTVQQNEAKKAFEQADLTKAAETLSQPDYAEASASLLQMVRWLKDRALTLSDEDKQRLPKEGSAALDLIRNVFPVTRPMSADRVCVELCDKIIALSLGGLHKQLEAILQHTPLNAQKERALLTNGLHEAQRKWKQANASL